MAKSDFVHSCMPRRTLRCAQSVDEEHPEARQSQKCFPRPLLDQLGWNHGQGCERLSLAVHMDGAERNERFSSPTLRDHRFTTPMMASACAGNGLRRSCAIRGEAASSNPCRGGKL